MGKIRMRSTALSDNPELKAPVFNFSKYVADGEHTYKNNEEQIDFVTANDSLYVCLSHDGVTPTYEDIDDNADFLKLVSQGPQGIRGPRGYDGNSAETPRLNAEFDNDQLRVYINGELETVSPRLTGKSWRPKLEDNMIVWELSNKMYAPEPIDLEELRPIQERPLLLRVDSDNTKRTDEKSGPARFIQWKYEGEGPWTNLISISELMNLTLAGITIFPVENTETGKTEYHLGHKEVLEATYDSDKDGHRIISNVELGHVLFDAGPIPIGECSGGDDNDFQEQIDLILADLARLDTSVVKSITINGDKRTPNPLNGDVELRLKTINNHSIIGDGNINIPTGSGGDLSGYATESWVQNNYQPKGNYVTSVNGVSPQPGSNGAITISVGNLGSFDIRLKSDGKTLEKTLDGTTWNDIVDLSQFEGSGSGCDKCWSQEEIVQLIENVLSGRIPTNMVVPSDLDAYVKWTDIAGTYATMSWVSDEIARALSGGQYEPEYHRVFTLYKRTNDRLSPPNPPLANVWEWNITQGDILADSSFRSGWDNHPQNATTALPYLWMASATFSSITHKEVKPSNADSAWTLVCLTGEAGLSGANGFNGTDGADGNGVEFIFTLIRDINDKTIVDTPVAPSSSQPDSYPAGWEDHPQGIGYYIPNQVTTTLENLGNNEILFGIELASMRTGTNGEWGPYCAPFIWSMWGEDGVDGDGVEYIFLVADETSVEINDKKVSLPEQLWKVEGSSPNFIPTNDLQVEHLGPSYQVPDWVGTRNNGWTDNPSDVDAQQPFEFVSIRKYHDSTGWGPFCEPRLWSHFGGITINPVTTITTSTETNYVPYKEWAFYRANDIDGTTHTDLSTYDVVYDFSDFRTQSNPDPVYSDLTPEQKLAFYRNPELYTKTVKNGQELDITWQDTVPPGDGQLWVITAHIADESQSTDQGWTTPSRWGDKAGFNVEYSASREASAVCDNPSLWNNHNLTFNDFQGSDEQRESDWRTAVEDAGYGIWNDVVEEPKYMATTVLGDDGVWSKWTITKIVGEDGPRGPQGEQGQDGNGVEFVFFALTPEQYSNRSNFIGNDNRFYVYDNIAHEEKTWNQNEYLPYAIISDVPEGRLWATDNNPGITEERPYIFVSTRHQVNGKWSQFHNIPGTGLMSSFGPASLWLAGDEIDYAYARVNFGEDTVPVLVDASNHPVSRSAYNSANSVDFYHGNKRLVYKSAEVKVNDEWVLFQTVSTASSGTSSYTVTTTPITISQNLTLEDARSYTTDNTRQALGVGLVFGDGYTFNGPIEIPVRLTSFESYINSSGNQTFYSAEETLKFVPVHTETVLYLSSDGIIKKSTEDSDDYVVTDRTVGVFRRRLNGTTDDIGFTGVSSFPTTYSNWTVKVLFDDVQQYNIAIGNIYNYWRNNSWNDRDGESANFNSSVDKCLVDYEPNGSVRANNSTSPIYIEIQKTFTKDQHSDNHYVHDSIIIMILDENLPSTLKDTVKFNLYDGSTLIDSEIVPIIYNGEPVILQNTGAKLVSMNVGSEEVICTDEQNETASLSVVRANSVAESVDENLLNWYSDSTQIEDNYTLGQNDPAVISSSSVLGVTKEGDGFINVTKTGADDNLLKVNLNVDALVEELIHRFGGRPVVQNTSIESVSSGNVSVNGGYVHQGEQITITGEPGSTISGLYTDTSHATEITTLDANGQATGYVGSDNVTITDSTGPAYVPTLNVGDVTPGVAPAPSVVAALYVSIPSNSNGEAQLTFNSISQDAAATVTYTLTFSRAVSVTSVEGSTSHSAITGPYQNTVTVINPDPREIWIDFNDFPEGTLMWVYATASVVYDNEEPTVYTSAKKYFKTTKRSLFIH